MSDSICPLCGRSATDRGSVETNDPIDPLQHRWKCNTCGTFRMGDRASISLERDARLSNRRFLLSAYSKEGTDALIDEDLLNRLGYGGLRERTIPEKVEMILRWFADKTPEFGQEVVHEPQYNYPVGWCRSSGEWTRIVGMLVQVRKHLKAGASGSICTVTDAGWEWLARKPQAENVATAFVAMNFAPEYENLRRAIEQALTNAGYRPVVISSDLYVGGVMDRVLARIREARFAVADYTGNRGGVYYEAGFALGLGKTVIHSCSKEQLDCPQQGQRLHFDVAHLKMLPWTADNLGEYAEELENHIVAVLGRGPVCS